MDYYKILNVSKTASQDEIKNAYKKMVREHHPDRGGDQELFKKINEAYETLKDKDKRNEYDRPQYDRQNSYQNFHANDIFEQFFNFNRTKNRDIQLVCTLSLKESIQGGKKIIHYTVPSGDQRTVEIEFPPGIQTGHQLKYRGLGDNSIAELPNGNLIVVFDIVCNPDYEISGLDVYYNLHVSVYDLILGCEAEIKTAEDKSIKLKIKPNTSPNTKLSIPQEGIPELGSPSRGNFYIKFKVEMPSLSPEQINLLKQVVSGIKSKSV